MWFCRASYVVLPALSSILGAWDTTPGWMWAALNEPVWVPWSNESEGTYWVSMSVVCMHVCLCVHKNHICSVSARCWLSAFTCIVPMNSQDNPRSHSHFTDGEIEVQKGKVTCLRWHNWRVAQKYRNQFFLTLKSLGPPAQHVEVFLSAYLQRRTCRKQDRGGNLRTCSFLSLSFKLVVWMTVELKAVSGNLPAQK